MAITSLSLMQDNKNPNKIWLYFIDAGSGEPSQYLLDKDEFSKLQNAGVQVSRTVNDPLYYLKGNLPSFDFLLKKAKQPLPQGFGDEQQKKALQSIVLTLNKIAETPDIPYALTGEERASRVNAFIAQHQRAGTPYIEVPSDLIDGQYVVAGGVFQTKQEYEQSNQLKQQIAAGQMKNIGTPERPLYVPVGSPADTLNSQKQNIPDMSGLDIPRKPDGSFDFSGFKAESSYSLPKLKKNINPKQKEELQKMIQKHDYEWTEQDIKNWNYATNNAKNVTGRSLDGSIIGYEVPTFHNGKIYVSDPPSIDPGFSPVPYKPTMIGGKPYQELTPPAPPRYPGHPEWLSAESQIRELPFGLSQEDLNAFPDKKANRQFVDALFKEKYGRKATESEWRMIDGRTVSDATSFVLGTGQKNGDIVVLPKDLTDISILPDFIKNSDVFKALSPKNQELVAIQWNGIQATSALDKIRINEALKEATKLADPLFKQSILLARDTLERNLANTLATNKEAKDQLETELSIMKEDFVTKSSRLNEAQREAALKDLETISIVKDQAIREGESREAGVAAEVGRINRRITAINEDLKLGRGDIAVEEQAQLARYLKDYQRTLQTTQEQAVDAGLGFSSIRTEAEKRLAEDLQDVSESTRRQKARELRSLENQAGRETSELVATQTDIDRKNKEMRVDLAKQMEQKLGYSAVPDDIRKYLPGPTIIDKEGTVLRGEAERVQQERARELQQKEEDIKTSTKRAEADAQRQRQILEREREKSVTEQKRKAEEVLGSKKAQEILPGGPAPIGGIIGTLEQQQAEKIQTIGKSLFDTGFYPEEKK